ncbi:hypothetical protein M8R20_21640 [Pseudomonas sp. R2.Fl]|nr:hypothetical protein [Pseudomonas sp. R2.Fl]
MVLSLVFLWLVPAAAMLSLTYAEGVAGGNRWDVFRILGLVACLGWPLALPAVAAAVLVHRGLGHGEPPVLARHTDFV